MIPIIPPIHHHPSSPPSSPTSPGGSPPVTPPIPPVAIVPEPHYGWLLLAGFLGAAARPSTVAPAPYVQAEVFTRATRRLKSHSIGVRLWRSRCSFLSRRWRFARTRLRCARAAIPKTQSSPVCRRARQWKSASVCRTARIASKWPRQSTAKMFWATFPPPRSPVWSGMSRSGPRPHRWICCAR